MSSNLPISSPYRSTPDAPVSDAERNQLSTRLNSAFEAGQLDQDSYQSRLDQLFAATRLGELVPVVEGLPPMQTYADPAFVASTGGQPGQVSEAPNAAKLSLIVIGVVVAVIVLIVLLLFLLL